MSLAGHVGRGLRDLGRKPVAQALTILAVGLTTFLAGLFLMTAVNLNQALLQARGEFVYQVYWQRDADLALVREQWDSLKSLTNFRDKRTFTPDQALEELTSALEGGGSPMAGLRSNNPLPPTAVVYFSAPKGDPELFVQQTLAALQRLKGVKDVHYSVLELDLAKSWVRFSRTVIWPLIVLLAVVGALVVGNTMKLSLMNRRDEVEILQLVGATRSYIRLPLVVGGATIGLLGGLVAIGLLKAVQLGIADLCATPPMSLAFPFLPTPYALGLVLGTALVGALSSIVALRGN